jgi:hypothetical protein
MTSKPASTVALKCSSPTDLMIAHEQALAHRRCEGSHARDRCNDEEFRRAVPWILLGNPRCREVPTQ